MAEKSNESRLDEIQVAQFSIKNFTDHFMAPACKRANVKMIRFHDLRHTFATHFIERYSHFHPDFLGKDLSHVNFSGDTKKSEWDFFKVSI